MVYFLVYFYRLDMKSTKKYKVFRKCFNIFSKTLIYTKLPLPTRGEARTKAVDLPHIKVNLHIKLKVPRIKVKVPHIKVNLPRIKVNLLRNKGTSTAYKAKSTMYNAKSTAYKGKSTAYKGKSTAYEGTNTAYKRYSV